MRTLDIKKIQEYDSYEAHNASVINQGDYICTYGTLRTQLDGGHFRAGVMQTVLPYYRGLVRIPRVGMYANINSGFPFAVVTHNPDHFIIAEAYEIVECVLPVLSDFMQALDAIEGAPTFYHRTRVRTIEGDDYWMYTVDDTFTDDGLHKTGDWADIVNQRATFVANGGI